MKYIQTRRSIAFIVVTVSLALVAMRPLFSCAKDDKADAESVSEKGGVVETLPLRMLVHCAKDDKIGANSVGERRDDVEAPNSPMIIWFHPVETDPEILRLALSSGVFSHLMLTWLHEYDRPYSLAYPLSKKGLRNLQKALRLCKEKEVEVIWTRWLYPGYNHIKFPFISEDIFEATYYVQRVRNIRKEARLMGVDLVALDTEPYGASSLKPMRMGRYELSEAKFGALRNAIKAAIKAEGRVDFVLPAPRVGQRHLYTATSGLGRLVIGEHTYRDVPRRRNDRRRPYDIFGAYVSIRKEDPNYPKMPYFTPREILERQDLWAHKKGLFIFPGVGRKNVEAVALEFSKMKYIRPVRDSNDVP